MIASYLRSSGLTYGNLEHSIGRQSIDKTPAADLEKAERLREQYFEQKHLRK